MTQTAREYCREGRHEPLTPEGNEHAKELYKRAIAVEPGYMPAYAELSYVYVREFQNAWSKDRWASLEEALQYARVAESLTASGEWRDDFRGLWYLAIVYWNKGAFHESYAEFRTARSLIPLANRPTYEPDLDADMAEALIYGGQPELAVQMIKDAMRRKPLFPYWFWWNLGRAFYMCKDYQDAIQAIQQITDPPNDVRLITAASHAQLGHDTEAKTIMAAFSTEDPDWTVEKSAAYHYERDSDREHWIEGLRKAGLK